jgi:hypothetical protein
MRRIASILAAQTEGLESHAPKTKRYVCTNDDYAVTGVLIER